MQGFPDFSIQQAPEIDWKDWCWRLDDGRVWATKQVGWADTEFVQAWLSRVGLTEVPLCGVHPDWDVEANGPAPHDEEGLRYQLSFFGVPVGELGTEEERMDSLRRIRNEMLAISDFSVEPDTGLSEEALETLKAFRHALRELPNMEGAPWDGGYSKTPWPVLDTPEIARNKEAENEAVRQVIASLPPKLYHQKYDVNDLVTDPVFVAKVQLRLFIGAQRAMARQAATLSSQVKKSSYRPGGK